MKTNKALLFGIMLAVALTGASAQTEVTAYNPGITPEGITYCLPRTQLRVRVTATCVKYTPGDFRPYASRFLRLDGISREASTTWTIDGIKIFTEGVPDETKMFTIKLSPKTSAPLAGLTADGILLSINADAPAAAAVPELPAPAVTDNNLNPRDFMSQEILTASSVVKQAELTAGEIYDIRESRTALAKGEADNMPKDGEQLKLMISSLNTQETALLQMFKGTQTTETRSFDFVYLPTQDAKDVLFRFSRNLGVLDADNLAGAPVYISIADKHSVPEPVVTDKKKKEVMDVRYNVPSQVDVKISDIDKEYLSATFPMGQFGNVEHLGAEPFNKKMDTQVLLNPVTGGIDKLQLPDPSRQ